MFSDACDGAGTCAGAAELEMSCVVPDPGSGGSRLTLRGSGTSSDRLGWSWGKGAAIAIGALGNPAASDDFALCVFADDGVTSRVVVSAVAPAGAA